MANRLAAHLALQLIIAVMTGSAAFAQGASTSRASFACAAFSGASNLLAVGSRYQVLLFDAVTGKRIGAVGGAAGMVTSLAFSPNGKLIAAAGGIPGQSGEILLIEAASRQIKQRLKGHSDAIYGVAFSPTGDRVAACSYDHLVSVWTLSTGKPRFLKDHTDSVNSVAWSPNGKWIASGGNDRTVKVWEAQSGKRLYTLSDATAEVRSIAFSPDGSVLAAGSADKTVRTWQVKASAAEPLKSAFAHEAPVLRVAFGSAGKTIYSVGEDLALKTWDAATLAEVRSIPGQSDWPHGLAVMAKGDLVAVARHDGSLSLYDGRSGKLVRHLIAPKPKTAGQAAPQKPTPTTSRVPGTTFGKRDPVRPKGGVTLFSSSLGSVSPISVRTGSAVRMTLSGARISQAIKVFFDDPAITGVIVEPRDPNPGIVRVDAKIEGAARTGLHRVTVQSPSGTTGSVVFGVYPWPEIAQTEPNNDPATAQLIQFDCTVAGTLDAPGDVDVYRFEAKPGDEFVFDVVAQPLRSRLQAVMDLLDPAGKVMATSKQIPGRQDAMLGWKFMQAGTYSVRVRDFDGAGGGDVYYRLNAGRLPVVTSAYPLAVSQGETAPVMVDGFNIGGPRTVQVTAPKTDDPTALFGVPVPGLAQPLYSTRQIAAVRTPATSASGRNTERSAADRVPTPGTVSGILNSPTGSGTLNHYYTFEAKKGRKLLIDTLARRAGSLLDSDIEILDSKGQPVESAVLRAVFQTEVTLFDRDSSSSGIRIFAWNGCNMRDLMMIGREVIQILRLPNGPDEDVFFRTLRGQRVGYLGTTPEFHSVGSPIYKVEVYPPGTKLSPNGYPQVRLTYKNDDGSPLHGKDSSILFDPPADGTYTVRVADSRGQSSPEFVYALSIREPRPDFTLSMNPGHINLPQGGISAIEVSCERFDGFDGPIAVELNGLPNGFTATKTVIEGSETTATLLITAEPDAVTPMAYSAPIRLTATAVAGGRTITRSIEPDNGNRLITVMPPPDVRVSTDKQEIVIRPGEEIEVEGLVDRLGKFGGRVPLSVKNLPYGVRVLNIGLNGVLVTEEESSRRFSLYCEPWVQPMERWINVSADIEGGVSVGSVPILLRVLPTANRAAAISKR